MQCDFLILISILSSCIYCFKSKDIDVEIYEASESKDKVVTTHKFVDDVTVVNNQWFAQKTQIYGHFHEGRG